MSVVTGRVTNGILFFFLGGKGRGCYSSPILYSFISFFFFFFFSQVPIKLFFSCPIPLIDSPPPFPSHSITHSFISSSSSSSSSSCLVLPQVFQKKKNRNLYIYTYIHISKPAGLHCTVLYCIQDKIG